MEKPRQSMGCQMALIDSMKFMCRQDISPLRNTSSSKSRTALWRMSRPIRVIQVRLTSQQQEITAWLFWKSKILLAPPFRIQVDPEHNSSQSSAVSWFLQLVYCYGEEGDWSRKDKLVVTNTAYKRQKNNQKEKLISEMRSAFSDAWIYSENTWFIWSLFINNQN